MTDMPDKPPPLSYCKAVLNLPADDPNRHYHDHRYGFPITDDDALFGRLIMEINQAGLSWSTILKKEDNLRRAYTEFNIDMIAAYSEEDRRRLLGDSGIIRNRLKINAAIENARRIVAIREEFGSFKGWLDSHHPRSLAEWTALFKKTFVFTGGEIVKEFLMSTAYLPGAHEPSCPVFAFLSNLHP